MGEAGELANKWKKFYRDKPPGIEPLAYLNQSKSKLRAELGDVLWYVSNLALELGIDLDTIAEENIMKLRTRQVQGTLNGSGDNR